MHPPILRCLVPGAMPAVGPLAEPGEIAPVPAVLAIETLTAYLRSVDPRREDRRTWEDFLIDNGIYNDALLARCTPALDSGRRAARARVRIAHPTSAKHPNNAPETLTAPWQLRLSFGS